MTREEAHEKTTIMTKAEWSPLWVALSVFLVLDLTTDY